MQATLELLSQHGFHGTPISMIAEKAGVERVPSTGTFRIKSI